MTDEEIQQAIEEHRERQRYKGKGDPRDPKRASWEKAHLETVRQRDARLRREAADRTQRFAELESRGQQRLFTAKDDAELRVHDVAGA